MSYIENRIKSFYKKFDKKDSGCWEWNGYLDKGGYGRFGWNYENNKGQNAHRFSAKYLGGLNIDGLCVCHHCDNPRCVNPDHLFVGTVIDNIKDRELKGRHNFGIFPNNESKVKVKTPLGIFDSIKDAAKFHKVDPTTITNRIKTKSSEYVKL